MDSSSSSLLKKNQITQFVSTFHCLIGSNLKRSSEITLIPCGFDPYSPLHPSICVYFLKLVSFDIILTLDRVFSMTSRSRSITHPHTHFLSHLSLPPTHIHTLSLTLVSHARTHTHTLYHLILPPTHTHTLSPYSPTHPPTHTLSHTLVSHPLLADFPLFVHPFSLSSFPIKTNLESLE